VSTRGGAKGKGKKGAKSRAESPVSTKGGKGGKAPAKKGGPKSTKSKRSESPVSTKGGGRGGKAGAGKTPAIKGGKKIIESDDDDNGRGRSKSRGNLKGGKEAPTKERAKSAKKVTIDAKEEKGKGK